LLPAPFQKRPQLRQSPPAPIRLRNSPHRNLISRTPNIRLPPTASNTLFIPQYPIISAHPRNPSLDENDVQQAVLSVPLRDSVVNKNGIPDFKSAFQNPKSEIPFSFFPLRTRKQNHRLRQFPPRQPVRPLQFLRPILRLVRAHQFQHPRRNRRHHR